MCRRRCLKRILSAISYDTLRGIVHRVKNLARASWSTVKQVINTWALVLAGGEGTRLHGLTRNTQGVAVPKQFCSLRGGASLLEDALRRASAVAPLQRICTVVAEQHRHWWTPQLSYLQNNNVVVQPLNRGTAHGILLPLLRIAARDPGAVVVLLPADHYVSDEAVMMESLRRAAELAAADGDSIYLLGIEPDEIDAELGYILPTSRSRTQAAEVRRFIEKPSAIQARALIERGALWNTFILAGSVTSLLGIFGGSFATTIAAMRGFEGATIGTLYERLDSLDFSRDVLQGKESSLKVLAVPKCGWTDLGTPKRVGQTLSRLAQVFVAEPAHQNSGAQINLADQYARLHRRPAARGEVGHIDLRA
jgi:mannose-1-phosphate guanylyltransferase